MSNLMKKVVLIVLIFVVSTFIITGCSFFQAEDDKTSVNISEISLEDSSEERVESDIFSGGLAEYKGRFTVTPGNAKCDDLELVFDNENIIESTSIEKGIIKDDFVYKIKAKYNGKAVMYIKSKDGNCKSESKTFYFLNGVNDPTEVIKIGETATDYYYNVDFKVNKVTNAKSFSNGYVSINTENNFLLVELEILNKGKQAFHVNPNNFVVKKYNNNEVISSFEYDPRTWRFEDGMSSCDLNYGVKRTFVILYEIDKSTEEGNYRIFCQGTSDKSGVVIRLKN